LRSDSCYRRIARCGGVRIFAIGGMMGRGEAFGAESLQKVRDIGPNASPLQVSRSAA
jgi:hypothetical protein